MGRVQETRLCENFQGDGQARLDLRWAQYSRPGTVARHWFPRPWHWQVMHVLRLCRGILIGRRSALLHVDAGIGERGEAELGVEPVRIAGAKLKSAQALQARMGDHCAHERL